MPADALLWRVSPHTLGMPLTPTNGSARRPWLLLFAGTTVVLFVAAWAFFKFESRRVRDDIYGQLAAVGALKAGQVQSWRAERLGDATVTAQRTSLARAATAP